MIRLIYAIILTILPIFELRAGLPLGILYALENNIPLFIVFSLIILTNILLVFFVFYFLDKFHKILMNVKFYRKTFERYLKKFQKRVDKFEKHNSKIGFFALVLFVAIPLPGTGAWTGCLVSWLLDLDRKKSILAICLGVIIAGSLIFSGLLIGIGFFA